MEEDYFCAKDHCQITKILEKHAILSWESAEEMNNALSVELELPYRAAMSEFMAYYSE